MKRRLTAKELETIWREMRGSTPGLYVPVSRVRQVERLGPRLAVFRSFSEISKEDPVENYWDILNEVSRDAALPILSAINLIIALAAIDSRTHQALNSTFI